MLKYFITVFTELPVIEDTTKTTPSLSEICTQETLDVVEGTRSLLQEYADRFVVCAPDSTSYETEKIAFQKSLIAPRGGIAGYISLEKEGFYVEPYFFKDTICKRLGKSDAVVKKILKKEGYLIPGSSDHLGTRFTPPYVYGDYTVRKESRQRYYRIYYPELFPAVKEPESEAPHDGEETKDATFDI